MKEMTIDEIKRTQLDILIYVDKICKENNIKYSIAYGTLLGAVRHKGFIPWDDDIDILIMKSDYNKLLDILYRNTSDKYRVFSPRDKGYFYPYAKVSDKDTIIMEKNWPDYDDIGVNIDLFPVDYAPNGKEREYYDEVKYYENCLHNCLTDIAYVHNKKYMRLIKRVCRYRLVKKCRQKDEWYWKNKLEEMTNQNDSNKVICALAPYYCLWDKSMFDDYTEMEFENNNFSAVSDYDKMLESIYGDYMQLPPEKERVSNHDFTAYWKE